ncbi:ABC transporter substrate-binding protein [Paenibacillus sp. TRM 82003]|uniref:ABC transporter substrate-binding protein n=1 Tax=Kineococcus sp. TRM81007 TaxID=2925831 RepID=UPI001F5617FE|nr:ABC transporter substrate-binding protein [Kineococcus sp. TRM81007]MCI2237858.1 ABC transporter substrate-binding protein [Kineococcus sp. TRM81007]MCI3924589.1 ABC transporter substrate-binding protein [Paenibacillus sp. TRM 82003]
MRRRTVLSSLAATPIVAAGCSTGDGVDTGDTGQGGGEGGGEFVAAISAQPDQFDPHKTTAYASFQVLENVYDTLVVPGAEDQVMQPSLATDWTTSEDGLTWTFTLRDDVTFHDGSTFDADDVVFSYDRIIDQQLSNAYRFATVTDVRAQDPRTVVITVSEPTPALLAQIGGFKGMAILPSGVDEASLTTQAVGTGPFRLESTSASEVSLSRFDDYWGEASTLDGMTFRFLTEPAAAMTALTSGQVQWTDNVPTQDVSDLAEDDQVELGQVASVDYWYLAMNHAKAPFDNRDVRRAIATAVDRSAVTEAARFDAARPNQTAIPEDSYWHHDYAPFSTDVDEAKRLLEGAGVTTPITMGLMVTSEYPETVTAAQVLASQLEPLGVQVEIQTEDFATWLDRQGRGDFDAFMLGWLGNIDPFDYYDGQHRTGGSNNFHGYSSPVTDDLLNRAAVATDREERKDLYDQAAEQIVDDVSYLYLYNPDVVQAWTPGLTGYTIRPDKAVNFEEVELPS